MPDITAVKTWATREDLTSTDLNAEFSNVYNNAVGKSVAQTISGRKTFTGGIIVDELLSIAASGAGHVKLADFRWDPASGTLADLDGFYYDWTGDDDVTPTETIYARDGVEFADVSDTTEDGVRFWSVVTAGTLARELNLSGAALYPQANDGLALGTTTLGFADFHLATGGVINWANGEVTITETDANTLTIAGTATLIDIAAGIFELNNALRFDTGVAMVAAAYAIGRDADATNQLHFNVPTGAGFEWSINDTAEVVLDATNFKPGSDDGNALGVSGTAWADLFLASGAIIDFAASDVTLTHSSNLITSAGGNWNFGANIVYVNDTANGSMTTGITVNQGTATNEGYALKGSNVAHGMTAVAETDTFLGLKRLSGADGVGHLFGLGGAVRALYLRGYGTTEDTTDTSTSTAPVWCDAQLKSGTGSGAYGTTAVIFAVSNADAVRLLVKGNGDVHVTNTTLTALDDMPDALVMRAGRAALAPEGSWLHDGHRELIAKYAPILEERRIMFFERDGDGRVTGAMNNIMPSIMLAWDGLYQHHGRITELEAEIAALKARLN